MKILSYTAGGREEFMKDTLIQDGVVRNFEIIGEATKRLSNEAKLKRLDVPWRAVAGFRDVLIHDYMGVDLEEVWQIVESRLSQLRDAVEELLKS